jgi:hypothetical protein
MTSFAALIPRIRFYTTGSVMAIRCTHCHQWRKPRQFTPDTNVCRPCLKGPARRHYRAPQRANSH